VGIAAVVIVVRFGKPIAEWYDRNLAAFVSREFISSHWNGDIRSWMTIALIAAVATGSGIAWWMSKRFRPSRRSGLPRRARSGDPAGLATAWSPVYGFVYIAIGVCLIPICGLFGAGTPLWAKVASVVSLVFGLLFSLVAVILIPYLRERRIVKKLAAQFESNDVGETSEEVIKAFNRIGEFASYLTKGGDTEQLSRHGWRIYDRARRSVQRRALGRKAVSPRRKRAKKVDTDAVITVSYNGHRHRVGLGKRRHETRVTVVIDDSEIKILDDTGQLIGKSS